MQIGVLTDLHVCNAKSEFLEKYLLHFLFKEKGCYFFRFIGFASVYYLYWRIFH